MDEDSFKYYEIRIEELDKLLKEAKSQTFVDLIKKAKNLSEQSVQNLIAIHKATIKYLADHNIKNTETLKKYNEHIDLREEKVNQLKTATIPDELRATLNDFYRNHFNLIQRKLQFHTDLNTLTINTFTNCCKEFEKTLLQIVFKPRSGQFHYETVMDVVNYIASKLIPGLEELKTASSFPITLRKNQFVNTGDKIALYLEQYIDVLEKLEVLSNAYLKILEE